DADAGTFSASGLPPGLSIDPTTGVISGTIGTRAAGTYAVTVSAADNGHVRSTFFTWTVTLPPGPVPSEDVVVLLGPIQPKRNRQGKRIPGRFTQTVQVFSVGALPIEGPITLVLNNMPLRRLSQHGRVRLVPMARLTNADGVTEHSQPRGSPYKRVAT